MFFFLPDWAPNIHPLVVHFPIALLFTAGLLDVVGLFMRDRVFLRRAAMLLYGLGGLAVVAAFFAGKQAADSVFLSTEANAALTEHADLGLWTLWFFGLYGLLRPVVDLTALGRKTGVRFGAVIIALAGLGLLYTTAEHGAELVFRHGAGVEAVDHSIQSVVAPMDSSVAARSAPVIAENGSWTWKPTRAAAWKSVMTRPDGAADFARTAMMDGGDRGDVLALTTEEGSAMFVYDSPLGDFQIDAAVNLDGFDGVVMFTHSVRDASNYRFTSVGNGEMRIGRSENNDLYMLDTQSYTAEGWVSFRAVADQSHYRAYADEVLVAHGHGDAATVGPVGIRLNGTGTVLFDFMRVEALR